MIAAAHRHLDGRDYRLVDPDYKSGKETNCSIATWQICEDYFGLELTAEEQRDWMIVDPARPWSPIDAVVSAGIGAEVDGPIPGRYHLVQTWRSVSPLNRGHSKIYFEPPSPMVDGCLVIQATYDMGKAFLSVESFAEAVDGLQFRLAVLNER
ncbi:MAG: hypothetical protein HRU00_14230 [Myxococcales bacterium]|nr:hypothetical protein [Myxococcales bacterium]